MRNSARRFTATLAVLAAIGTALSSGSALADGGDNGPTTDGVATNGAVAPLACPDRDPVFNISNTTVSSRPTDVYSAYITGPGTISYNQTRSATVSAGVTSTTQGDINLIVASASQSIGVNLAGSRTWNSGFTYSLDVPAGQTRRMRLFQESRSFLVTKKSFSVAQCKFVTVYSNSSVNAPKQQRVDSWRLED